MPTLEQARRHFEQLYGDAEPAMRQVVRVFVGDETYCPGFQFQEGQLNPQVLQLFTRAMELNVPHNVFAAWMMTPLWSLQNARPVDAMGTGERLEAELASFAEGHRPAAARR